MINKEKKQEVNKQNEQVVDAYIIPKEIYIKVLRIVGKAPSEISDGIYTFLKNQNTTKITLLKDKNIKDKENKK